MSHAPLGCGNQLQPAGVLHDEALQEVVIQPVRVFQEIKEMETGLSQLKVQRGIAEIGVQIEQQGLASQGTGQQGSKLSDQGGRPAPTFGSHESQNLASALLLLVSPA